MTFGKDLSDLICVGTLLETLPDHVEITGNDEITDKITHCYREGEELYRGEW